MTTVNTMFKFSSGDVLQGNTKNTLGTRSVADLEDKQMLVKSFFAVEQPFVLKTALPNDLRSQRTNQQKGTGAPVKSAFNLFDTFEEATEYAQRMNTPLVILEIKPTATSKPQTSLITKLSA